MPRHSDPAPCGDDGELYECIECGKRLCSPDHVSLCPNCGARMQNLSTPRPE